MSALLRKFFSCFFLVIAVFGKNVVIDAKEPLFASVQECYNSLSKAFQDEKWQDLLQYSSIIVKKYPASAFVKEAYYYQGIASFHLEEWEQSYEQLTEYLTLETSPKFFQEALEMKYEIAEKFREGKKRRLFGLSYMPKWLGAKPEAIVIYNEIIHSLPYHELGARSLYSKSTILFEEQEYQECMDTLQNLIKTFPKHELAIESYILIQKCYLEKATPKQQDSNLLDLARLNFKKFEEAFPYEDRISLASDLICQMEEIYAQGLFDIGKFYEKTKKYKASSIYYSEIIQLFPNTKYAKFSMDKIDLLKKKKVI